MNALIRIQAFDDNSEHTTITVSLDQRLSNDFLKQRPLNMELVIYLQLHCSAWDSSAAHSRNFKGRAGVAVSAARRFTRFAAADCRCDYEKMLKKSHRKEQVVHKVMAI